jgi:hypothetical protein
VLIRVHGQHGLDRGIWPGYVRPNFLDTPLLWPTSPRLEFAQRERLTGRTSCSMSVGSLCSSRRPAVVCGDCAIACTGERSYSHWEHIQTSRSSAHERSATKPASSSQTASIRALNAKRSGALGQRHSKQSRPNGSSSKARRSLSRPSPFSARGSRVFCTRTLAIARWG